jgi:hypothetical protein
VDHLSTTQIERYLSRTASPAEIGEMLAHGADCPDCREQLCGGSDQLDNLVSAFKSFLSPSSDDAAEPYHLSAETMAAYLSGHLDDVGLEIANGHLESCEQCTNELFELRALERLVLETPAKNSVPPLERLDLHGPTLRSASFMKLALATTCAAAIVLGVGVFVQHRELVNLKARDLLVQKDMRSSLDAQRASISQLNAEMERLHSANDDSSKSSQQAVADLNDASGVVKLDKQGGVTGLGSLPAPYEDLIRTALITHRVEIPHSSRMLSSKPEILLGRRDKSNSFSLLSPVGAVVSSQTPTFRWSPLIGATGYVVGIFNSKLNPVAASPALSDTQWSPRELLKRGAIYYWQVTATKGADEIISPGAGRPDAKFKVLDATKYEELAGAERTYKGSHLLMGLLYARAGLLDEARREFRALKAANTGSSVVEQLLQSVRAVR